MELELPKILKFPNKAIQAIIVPVLGENCTSKFVGLLKHALEKIKRETNNFSFSRLMILQAYHTSYMI